MSTKLLLDVDPGNDDAIATFVALANEDVDVVGLTTVMGNTTLENATHNALSLLELVDRADVPVAAGAARPLSDDLETAEHVHGPGGLPEDVRAELPEPTAEPIDAHAVEFIVEQAREHGEDLTIAAVGPSTNLALAIALEPELPDLVGNIFLMGGAMKTTGNVTPQASFNFYVDAPAASRVVQEANPKIVGLDVTEHVYVGTDEIERLLDEPAPLSTIAKILAFSVDEVKSKFGHDGGLASDAVVVSDVIGGLLTFEAAYVEIDTTGGPSNGATIYDEHGVLGREPNARVALEIDHDAYPEIVLENLEKLA
ncbi:nucleoside hydrolase [Halegenticoccus soli]|uniref:nucleoside hydrolase n=1 Tax=Halegenticoccus soli TaxID=1985678 RepID=UPI000C6CE94D|nr:nucleoside hydrolase [Halegenticoccus soli]